MGDDDDDQNDGVKKKCTSRVFDESEITIKRSTTINYSSTPSTSKVSHEATTSTSPNMNIVPSLNHYEENDVTYNDNHNGDESSNDNSDEYHFVVENGDDGVEDNEYVDDSNINDNTSSKDNSHFSPEAVYNQQSIANDLTDDLHAIEMALKNERVERQKDKEEADVRAEALMKANTDLTKALTKAELTIQNLRDELMPKVSTAEEKSIAAEALSKDAQQKIVEVKDTAEKHISTQNNVMNTNFDSEKLKRLKDAKSNAIECSATDCELTSPTIDKIIPFSLSVATSTES